MLETRNARVLVVTISLSVSWIAFWLILVPSPLSWFISSAPFLVGFVSYAGMLIGGWIDKGKI